MSDIEEFEDTKGVVIIHKSKKMAGIIVFNATFNNMSVIL